MRVILIEEEPVCLFKYEKQKTSIRTMLTDFDITSEMSCVGFQDKMMHFYRHFLLGVKLS